MSQTRPTTFARLLILLLGLGGLAAASWLMFFGDPTPQRTGLGLAALVVGGGLLVRWTHRTGRAVAPEEVATDLGNEHLAPNDPLAWMDIKKKEDGKKGDSKKKDEAGRPTGDGAMDAEAALQGTTAIVVPASDEGTSPPGETAHM